jgi:hypothetical protein
MDKQTEDIDIPTHNFIAYITLHHDLILPLGVLGHRAAGRKLASKELCYFLQIEAKGVETVDVGGVFPSRPFGALDDDLQAGLVSASPTADGKDGGSVGEDRWEADSTVELSRRIEIWP